MTQMPSIFDFRNSPTEAYVWIWLSQSTEPKLADIVRLDFRRPKEDLLELFRRMVFNVLCGNTDDHARNHAAFWNGESLSFTPAYKRLFWKRQFLNPFVFE